MDFFEGKLKVVALTQSELQEVVTHTMRVSKPKSMQHIVQKTTLKETKNIE